MGHDNRSGYYLASDLIKLSIAESILFLGFSNNAAWSPPASTTQAGAKLVEILAQMGATTELTATGLSLTGPESISGIDINLRDVGELTPVVAAIAALAYHRASGRAGQ